jgi:hypothetical protein
MAALIIIFIVWGFAAFAFLLNYTASENFYETTNLENVIVLLVCLPATIFVSLVYIAISLFEGNKK